MTIEIKDPVWLMILNQVETIKRKIEFVGSVNGKQRFSGSSSSVNFMSNVCEREMKSNKESMKQMNFRTNSASLNFVFKGCMTTISLQTDKKVTNIERVHM